MPVKKKIIAVKKKTVSAPAARKKTVMKIPMKRVLAAKKVVQNVAVKQPEKKSLQLGLQFLIAGSAIAVLLLLGVVDRVTFSTLRSKASDRMPSTIGLEHKDPLTLSLLVARKNGAGYVSVTNQSTENIHISVPSNWKRMEVTGAPLDAITQDIPVFGFTRWSLPGNAGIKMETTDVPDALFFDSTSQTTTQIDLQTIDLTSLSANSRVVLMQKQALAQLWEAQE